MWPLQGRHGAGRAPRLWGVRGALVWPGQGGAWRAGGRHVNEVRGDSGHKWNLAGMC